MATHGEDPRPRARNRRRRRRPAPRGSRGHAGSARVRQGALSGVSRHVTSGAHRAGGRRRSRAAVRARVARLRSAPRVQGGEPERQVRRRARRRRGTRACPFSLRAADCFTALSSQVCTHPEPGGRARKLRSGSGRCCHLRGQVGRFGETSGSALLGRPGSLGCGGRGPAPFPAPSGAAVDSRGRSCARGGGAGAAPGSGTRPCGIRGRAREGTPTAWRAQSSGAASWRRSRSCAWGWWCWTSSM